MWFPASSLLLKADRATVFTLLAWAELFDEYTPDIYRPQLLDTYGLFQELENLALDASSNKYLKSHLYYVIAELKNSALRDPIINDFYPQVINAVNGLKPDKPVEDIRTLAKVAISEIEDYPEHSRAFVHTCSEKMPRYKGDMLSSLQLLSTRVQLEGIDNFQCQLPIDESNLNLSLSDIVAKIIDCSRRSLQKWTCVVAISGDKDDIRSLASRGGFMHLPKRLKPLGKLGKEFLSQTKELSLCYSQIEACGPLEAVVKAVQPLRQIFDLANFMYNAAPFNIHHEVFVQYERTQTIIDLSTQSLIGLRPRKSPRQAVTDLLTRIPINKLPSSLLTALEQHTLAHTSLDLKTRFVNLWVALETLVGYSENLSIIEKIVRSVSPVVATHFIRKQLKYLAICLHHLGFCSSIPDTTGCFLRSTREQVRRDELLLVLSGKTGIEPQRKLCLATIQHPLLLFRLFLLHKQVSDSRQLAKLYRDSSQRTDWQIRRIYRARNFIAHQGKDVSWLPYMFENLQYYFSVAVSHVIQQLTRHPNWGIDECFEHSRMRLDYIINSLISSPQAVKLSDILQEGGPHKDVSLW